jgi:glutamate-5-semialdehyde dehydrogenase
MSEHNDSVHEDPLHVAAIDVRDAARQLALQSTATKNDALRCIAQSIREDEEYILQENSRDIEALTGEKRAFRDRLALDGDRVAKIAHAVEEVAQLPDPVGECTEEEVRPNGLRVSRQRIPLGVVAIIYEARPNVTADAAVLCLKSGNGVILKGGSDAIHSNRALYQSIRSGLEASMMPRAACGAVGFIDSRSRDAVKRLLAFSDCIDVVIPRGGKGLIRFVDTHARMPVIKHDEGVCHVVVGGEADEKMVDEIVLNAKLQRPTVCNAMETLLFLEAGLDRHLSRTLERLHKEGVTLHLCKRSAKYATNLAIPHVLATVEAYATEFLGPELSIRVTPDLEGAIAHINRYGSRHTEAIITSDAAEAERFVAAIDSSTVIVNASTRFADGNELGLGAEIGISTTRIHAYGPMGLRELTTTQFVVRGGGQIRT